MLSNGETYLSLSSQRTSVGLCSRCDLTEFQGVTGNLQEPPIET